MQAELTHRLHFQSPRRLHRPNYDQRQVLDNVLKLMIRVKTMNLAHYASASADQSSILLLSIHRSRVGTR